MFIRFLSPSIYGILITVAILICVLAAEKKVKSDGKPENTFWNISLLAVVLGIIGSRLYHVIDLWHYYSLEPVKIFYVWNGGLGIWGGIILALTGLLIFLKIKKEPVLYWLDLAASVLPLGQAIGRWGNFFNQENLGLPTSLPWGISIEPNNRPIGYTNFESFHPLFLYESILNLFLFIALYFIGKKFKRGNGIITYFYLTGYSIIRFFIEFLRINPWRVFGYNTAQMICIVALIGAGGIILKHPLAQMPKNG